VLLPVSNLPLVTQMRLGYYIILDLGVQGVEPVVLNRTLGYHGQDEVRVPPTPHGYRKTEIT